jgi:quinol monooxygenase YgiN
MISFLARLKFAPGDSAEIDESVRVLATASRQEPGCINYIPHRMEDDPYTVLFYEQYQDEKALEAHQNSKHFKDCFAGGLHQKIQESKIEKLVALI